MPTHLKTARTKSFTDLAQDEVRERVQGIISDIRRLGDEAVRSYAETFDHWTPESFRLSAEEIDAIIAGLPQQVIDDIVFVQAQVRGFAEVQRASMTDVEVETLPGVFLGHRHVPVQAAGAYVPGGKYPLTASAHMTIVTAKVAGVPRVVACTPPIRGKIPAATVAAMSLAGADEIWILGGVQAVAAMAVGTESMARVDMIAGPGNAFVAEAKRQLYGEVGIDLFAGPTEILIVADDAADPFLVAVDLLSQAEHGPESPAILITTSDDLARRVLAHVERILPGMPTADYAGPAWRDYGQVIVVADLDEAYALADTFASEHVQILTAEPRQALERMHHYGALFLGENTCVSYGDKVIGTNHVLPTLGAARYTGGLWVGKYLRTVTYQEVRDDATSGELGRVCGRASRVELFEGHARSGDVRAARHLGDSFEWMEAALAPTDDAGSVPEPAARA
ncbi:MAG: sulfopropanediol 3-dehydrogenase [Propionibacteriaceae bacterium]|nr:histidinol dehydrogenase [Propionibacteriaceae bacterium]MDX6323417.1 sulfopropanediol 3-dehydrogenase [Propionibacteriaceae bacterium]